MEGFTTMSVGLISALYQLLEGKVGVNHGVEQFWLDITLKIILYKLFSDISDETRFPL